MAHSRRLFGGSTVAGAIAVLAFCCAGFSLDAFRADLPTRLNDEDFWSLSEQLSEPNGQFQSDNLLSNETGYQVVIPELTSRLGDGGVYLGVGPEQNFTYIAALKPRIAFILDIRRGNRDLHLMYKALFELASDRAEFVSLLFSRARPAGLAKDATAIELFSAFDAVTPVDADYQKNLGRIKDVLVTSHHLPLSTEELQGVEYVYGNFYRFGPAIGYSSSRSGRGGVGPTYATLMRLTDGAGVARSYLANEDNFNVMKRLEAANLLVPVVGNFSGPTALRAIGTWLRDRNVKVSAYYLSNVEDYLSRDGSWLTFCQNALTLPLDEKSTFIRSGAGYRRAATGGAASTPIPGGISSDQLRALIAQGGGTITSPTGNVTVTTSGGMTFTAFNGISASMSSNRLGLMAVDLAPCIVPKFEAPYDGLPRLASARNSSR